MKVAIGLSLGFNVVFAFWCAQILKAPPPGGETVAKVSPILSRAAEPNPAGGKMPHAPGPSVDIDAYTRELNQRGFPPYIVRGLIKQRIHEQYARQRVAIRKAQSRAPYWSSDFGITALLGDSPETRQRLAELEREEREAIKGAVGTNASDFGIDELLSVRRFIGDIDPETATVVCADFLAKINEVTPDLVGTDSATREAFAAQVRAELRRQFESILTPDQLAEFLYRNDDALRRQLRYFNPTEAEFKSLSDLFRKSVGDATSNQSGRPSTPGDSDLRAILGDQRFEEYKQANDPAAAGLNGFVMRTGLSLEVANQLAAVERSFQQDVTTLSAQRMSTTRMQAKYQELLNGADATVRGLVGENNLSLYKQTVGSWLNTPAPHPPPRRK